MKRFVAALSVAVLIAACDAEDSVSPSQADLHGSFSATIPAQDFEPFADLEDVFGTTEWRLEFLTDQYRLSGPTFRVTEDVVASGDTLRVQADPAPEGAFNCEGDEADAVYSYELAEGSLMLEIEDEPCALRGVFLEREWERN